MNGFRNVIVISAVSFFAFFSAFSVAAEMQQKEVKIQKQEFSTHVIVEPEVVSPGLMTEFSVEDFSTKYLVEKRYVLLPPTTNDNVNKKVNHYFLIVKSNKNRFFTSGWT